MLRPLGCDVCFMAEYWLPDLDAVKPRGCPYPMRFVPREEFGPLYLPEWSNALCSHRAEYDRIAVGAYDGERLVGLAGASADCEGMWQIGIDVLPAYRMRGIASALTARLALAILEGGHVPFYCCAWSNVASARNAIASGFRPAWVQLTVKPQSVIDGHNAESR